MKDGAKNRDTKPTNKDFVWDDEDRLKKKLCQISFENSIFDGVNLEKKLPDVSDRPAIEGKSINCKSNSKTKNNVAENIENKTSNSSERLSIYSKSISGSHRKLLYCICLLYTSPSPRDLSTSRMPSSA